MNLDVLADTTVKIHIDIGLDIDVDTNIHKDRSANTNIYPNISPSGLRFFEVP